MSALQGIAKAEDDTLAMDHHCLPAGSYHSTTLLVERSDMFLTPGKAIWAGFGWRSVEGSH